MAETQKAWLIPAGSTQRIPLSAFFRIGRKSETCSLVPENVNGVSREHALITFDPKTMIWQIIDLGSTNGTYVQNTRIAGQTRIRGHSEIKIGSTVYQFVIEGTDPTSIIQPPITDESGTIIVGEEEVNTWLLALDICGSTKLSRELSRPEFTQRLNEWRRGATRVLNASNGVVNELTGDGMIAFWYAAQASPQQVADAVQGLATYQNSAPVPYRILLHNGVVIKGGALASGNEKFSGTEYNFFFKSEKPVSASGETVIISSEAATELANTSLKLRSIGGFDIPGFSGKREFFSI